MNTEKSKLEVEIKILEFDCIYKFPSFFTVYFNFHDGGRYIETSPLIWSDLWIYSEIKKSKKISQLFLSRSEPEQKIPFSISSNLEV